MPGFELGAAGWEWVGSKNAIKWLIITVWIPEFQELKTATHTVTVAK